jgi:hypothetical protein
MRGAQTLERCIGGERGGGSEKEGSTEHEYDLFCSTAYAETRVLA